ncbi:hypothetical protein CBL_11465 [Carabus blaptoides fortunei]
MDRSRFRGPSPEKYVHNTVRIDSKELKKIKVEIKRKIPGADNQPQELGHSLERPEEIKIYRCHDDIRKMKILKKQKTTQLSNYAMKRISLIYSSVKVAVQYSRGKILCEKAITREDLPIVKVLDEIVKVHEEIAKVRIVVMIIRDVTMKVHVVIVIVRGVIVKVPIVVGKVHDVIVKIQDIRMIVRDG